LGDKPQNHLNEYRGSQRKLPPKLEQWKKNECTEKGYSLPPKAKEYAAQEPELGPGKPLEPGPLPASPAPASPDPKK
jgi:hypothetical protein